MLSTTARTPLSIDSSATLVVAGCRPFRASVFAADDLVDAMRELDLLLELRVTGMILYRDTSCLDIQLFVSWTQPTIMKLSSSTQLNRTHWF